MEVRVSVLNIEWEWEVLVLSYYEVLVDKVARYGEELVLLLVTWLALCEELVLYGGSSLVDA